MPSKMENNRDESTDENQSILRKAIIVFAIIEVLVMVPVVLYLIFR